jgi:hypothetical protein
LKRRRGREAASFSGEVWTDGRGFATVRLPAAAAAIDAFDCEVVALGGVPARVSSERAGGRLTIETDEPHVRVAWRLVAAQHDTKGR